VEEAVESFLRQTHADSELIICNDEPFQELWIDHPRIRVINSPVRFPTLSDKIEYMIRNAKGDIFCRWDDDDISLPHRLEFSLNKLRDNLEWRPDNYWYDPGVLKEVKGPGNTHVMALWRKEVLEKIGGYPQKLSGIEDQVFNQKLAQAGIERKIEYLDPSEIFYIYRWATGAKHLSGGGSTIESLQAHWDRSARDVVFPGTYEIKPRWYDNHVGRVKRKLRMKPVTKTIQDIADYCDYHSLYDAMVLEARTGDILVEVGSLYGHSLCYLGLKAKEAEKRLKVYSVDLGIGVSEDHSEDFTDTSILLQNVRSAGVSDIVKCLSMDTIDGSKLFADNSLQFVFLDSGHDRDTIRTELQNWWPKIKPGGYLAGHDYNHPHHPAVCQEVDSFFHGGAMFSPIPSVWIKRKVP